MTAIILLNWNGWTDTIACLESLAKAEGDFFVVVADNNSSDDSLERLRHYVQNNGKLAVHILPLDRNYGFAVGNNKALEYAYTLNPDSYFLLNNDTEVDPCFLTQILEFSKTHQDYRALTPRINYFYENNLVWMCGGRLTFGSRERFYPDADESEVREKVYIPITYISGCALFFYPELLDSNHHLLSDRFFFGEEDFEFSLRMREFGVKMACVTNAVIYHKESVSQKKIQDKGNVGKHYSFYLGKMIGCRLYYGKLKFLLLKLLMYPKILMVFTRECDSFKSAVSLTDRLMRDVRHKYGISCEDFWGYMRR